MQGFTYAAAGSVDEALAAASEGAALAAGTIELLNCLRLGNASEETLVDISRLDALRGIERDRGALVKGRAFRDRARRRPRVGAGVSQGRLGTAEEPRDGGGNVLQSDRCPNFPAEAATAERMPWPCNERVAGSGCAALEGNYPRAALLDWTEECIATQPSDPVVALATLDAVAEVDGPDRPRSIHMTDFHLPQEEGGAGRETRLRAGEVILRYQVPVDAASRASTYLKVRERESYEYAMVSAAVCLHAEDGRVTAARIALGSVAQKPWRLATGDAALTGAALDEATLRAAMIEALADARPRPGQEWKPQLAANAATRALMMAGGIAR